MRKRKPRGDPRCVAGAIEAEKKGLSHHGNGNSPLHLPAAAGRLRNLILKAASAPLRSSTAFFILSEA